MSGRPQSGTGQQGATLWARRFELLTLTAFVALVAYPYVGRILPGEASLLALRALVLLASVHLVTSHRRVRWLAVALLVPALLGLREELPVWTKTLALASEASLYALTIAVAARTVFGRMTAGRDALFGAVAIYLLIGLLFAAAFELIESVAPGSLILAASTAGVPLHDATLYFSLATLTTLGYGDVTPAIDAVRSLVVVESVTGILYPAVVIARLVSLYASGEEAVAFDPPARAGSEGRRLEALFSVMLLQIVSYPYFPDVVSRGVGLLVLLVALYVIGGSRSRLAVGAVVAAPALAFGAFSADLNPVTALAERISSTAFLFLLTGMLMAEVFRREKVARDTLFGAGCVYLLLGLSWASLYRLVVHLSPTALGSPVATMGDTGLLYFSFVTLTTLGYGDLLPMTSAAQSLATLEAVIGILFPALLVARLVSIYR